MAGIHSLSVSMQIVGRFVSSNCRLGLHGRTAVMCQRAGLKFRRDRTESIVFGLRQSCAVMAVLTLTLIARVATAGTQTGPDAEASRRAPASFNIPAQPLADALYLYSTITGIEVLVPGDMVARRRSASVTGELTSEDALRTLLSGTGLSLRYTGLNAFTLVPEAPAAPGQIPRFARYSTALQAAITNALCRLHESRPGGYRIAARLWIGATGAVTRVSFLGTTGDTDRDSVLASLLGRLVVGEAPPANLPQPTTVLLLPLQDQSAECAEWRGARP